MLSVNQQVGVYWRYIIFSWFKAKLVGVTTLRWLGNILHPLFQTNSMFCFFFQWGILILWWMWKLEIWRSYNSSRDVSPCSVFVLTAACRTFNPICCMYLSLFIYIWAIFGVNVGTDISRHSSTMGAYGSTPGLHQWAFDVENSSCLAGEAEDS